MDMTDLIEKISGARLKKGEKKLIREAQKVLNQNWTGSFTQPSLHQYPHQWSWDSAFHAIGYAHFDQEKAEIELDRLFKGQWDNGMLPHIVFSGEVTSTNYFPGPEFWQTHRSPHAPDNLATSGICQPPVHATAVRHLLQKASDRGKAHAFAADIFPKLKNWHNFLYRERDPEDEGLVYIRHPWSSGQDNSPNWDQVLQHIDLDQSQIPRYERTDHEHVESKERPSDQNYDRYVYLIDFFRERDYDEKKIREDGCPFMVQDILFNSLLCQAGRDLGLIAEWLDKDPSPFQQQARKTANAINKKLWDENHGIYTDHDFKNDKRIEIHMLSGFIPLFASIPSPVRAERLFSYLNTRSFCRLHDSCLAVPSYDRRSTEYSSSKYWRGPIWINMNWLLYRGLFQYGHKNYDELIKHSIIELTKQSGFFEYYNPKTGEGYGAKDFSWSAALLLDILDSAIENE